MNEEPAQKRAHARCERSESDGSDANATSLAEARTQRAKKRAAEWSGEVCVPGTPKPRGYDTLSVPERLKAFSDLNRRVWRTAGYLRSDTPRAEWPGETFVIKSA